jgi:hypothetical protein
MWPALVSFGLPFVFFFDFAEAAVHYLMPQEHRKWPAIETDDFLSGAFGRLRRGEPSPVRHINRLHPPRRTDEDLLRASRISAELRAPDRIHHCGSLFAAFSAIAVRAAAV